MTVSVRIPTILRTFTGGAAEVTATAGTLREVIAGLDAAYPGIAGRIVDDTGKLRRFVNVYVGEEDVQIRPGTGHARPGGYPRVGDPGRRGRLTAPAGRGTPRPFVAGLGALPAKYAGRGVGVPGWETRVAGFGELLVPNAHGTR